MNDRRNEPKPSETFPRHHATSRLSRDINDIACEIYRLGMTLYQSGAYQQATFQFQKSLNMDPGFLDSALALGHCLHLLGSYKDAMAAYDQALALSPDSVVSWNNRGTTLLEMGRFEEAAASFSRALEFAPNLHDARIALATCLQAQGKVDDALEACDFVLAAAPENAEAHWNRSLLLLQKGSYPEGWREYEWRWKKRNFTSPHRNFPQPRWQGENTTNKTILIHSEQGFGDTLQFCRYVPLVAARGMHVIFECHPPLAKLMKSLAPEIDVVAMGQPLPSFDLHVPLMSLPLLFGTTIESIPATVPYLTPPEDRLFFWNSQIGVKRHLKAGLCWAGKSYPDPRRSCSVDFLTPLTDLGGISWYSLQTGWQGALPLPMSDLTSHIYDFADTAALIAQLDLVITIDTSVAHLAGALGKPTWVMLPCASDWRWMLEREDSPWYPSMKLFRLKKPDAWQDPIKVIRSVLKQLPNSLGKDGVTSTNNILNIKSV